MNQRKLTKLEIDTATQAVGLIFRLPPWSSLKGGSAYWAEVFHRLGEMIEHGTTDGEPWIEPGTPQSIDSSKPGFEMPADWYGKEILVTSDDRQKLIGWCQAYPGEKRLRYAATNDKGEVSWYQEIRFKSETEQ